VRSGDARPLGAILEHNRLDLLSLAALTSRLLRVTRAGPESARDAREALALGRVYGRAGHEERARNAFRSAIGRCRSPRGAFDPVRIEALRLLALALRRAHRFDEAAACWQELLEMRGCPAIVAREVGEALAIHHEHRLRDFATAKLFALRTAESARRDYRVARIERKIARAGESLKSEVRSLGLVGETDFRLPTSDLRHETGS
jgi:tetratricopeptide (TPR) repeat protein